LPSPSVTACFFCRVEGGQYPFRQIAWRDLEHSRHRSQDILACQNIPLHGETVSDYVPGVLVAGRAGKSKSVSIRVNYSKLTVNCSRVLLDEDLNNLLGSFPLHEELESLGTEGCIRERLSRDRTNTRARVRDYRSDAQKF
jgi:hypothetical protein